MTMKKAVLWRDFYSYCLLLMRDTENCSSFVTVPLQLDNEKYWKIHKGEKFCSLEQNTSFVATHSQQISLPYSKLIITCWFIQRKGVVLPCDPQVLIRLLQSTLGYIVVIPFNMKPWKKYSWSGCNIHFSTSCQKKQVFPIFTHCDHLSQTFQHFFTQWVSRLSPNLLYKIELYIFVTFSWFVMVKVIGFPTQGWFFPLSVTFPFIVKIVWGILDFWLTFNADLAVSYVLAFLVFSKFSLLAMTLFWWNHARDFYKRKPNPSHPLCAHRIHPLWTYTMMLKIILKNGGEHIHLTSIHFQKLMTLYISFSWKYFPENVLRFKCHSSVHFAELLSPILLYFICSGSGSNTALSYTGWLSGLWFIL